MPSSYALEGTRAHELAEKMLKLWLPHRSLDEAEIEVFRQENVDTEIDRKGKPCPNMVEHVLRYIGVVEEELAEFYPDPSILLERQLVLDPHLKMFGTCDLLVTGQRAGGMSGLIIDLKYGQGVAVTAENNMQLAYYAAALMKSSKHKLRQVKTVIVQPRKELWRTSHTWSRKALEEAEKTLINGAKRAIYQAATGEIELNAGDHCKFCPVKAICPARQQMG